MMVKIHKIYNPDSLVPMNMLLRIWEEITFLLFFNWLDISGSHLEADTSQPVLEGFWGRDDN